jgi:hypothetical protein
MQRFTVALATLFSVLGCATAGSQIESRGSSLPDSHTASTPNGSALRKVLTIFAIGEGKRRVLYPGPGGGELNSSYPVDRADDIVITFADEVSELKGSISVRARILGITPTEVPVENYTVVNDKELKEERKLLFADDTDFFRDKNHQKLLERISVFQRATTEYRQLLEGTLAMSLGLYVSGAIGDWFGSDNKPLPEKLRNGVSLAMMQAAIGNLRKAVVDEAPKQLQAVMKAIDDVRGDIETLFLLSDSASQLEDNQLRILRSSAYSLIADLTRGRASLGFSVTTNLAAIDGCTTKGTSYVAKNALTATDGNNVTVPIRANSYFRVDSTSGKIISPGFLSGYSINLSLQKDKINRVVDAFDDISRCYAQTLPDAIDSVRQQWRTTMDLESALLAQSTASVPRSAPPTATNNAPSPKNAQDADHAKLTDDAKSAAIADPAKQADAQPEGSSDSSLVLQIEKMKEIFRKGIDGRLRRGVRDARVRLSTLDVHHGDRVEVIVRVTRLGTSFRADEARGTVDIEERAIIRITDWGVTFFTSPQLGLIKRASDVRVANASEVPSNYKPAAGFVFGARLRTLRPIMDWVFPSVGLAAFAVDFDPTTSLEIGVGPSIGLLDEHIHAGAGWNLSVSDHRMFWWISLDFLRASETFAGLFGAKP